MLRRLAAILAADEAGTLAALRQLRAKVSNPIVACHRGRLVKSMGDGGLVGFDSARDDVTCAMRVQDRPANHPTLRRRRRGLRRTSAGTGRARRGSGVRPGLQRA